MALDRHGYKTREHRRQDKKKKHTGHGPQPSSRLRGRRIRKRRRAAEKKALRLHHVRGVVDGHPAVEFPDVARVVGVVDARQEKPLADGGRASPRTIAARNAATQSTPQDDKENPVRVVEKRLEAERRLTEALRREVALLKEQERDARRDADAWRKEAEKLRDEAARHAASAADASQGLEREAEMAWREAETWVEREEALERREAYAHESALGDAEQIAAPSPRSWPSSASSSKGRRRTHFAPASPPRGRDDDDDDESWAVALHRNAGKAEEPPNKEEAHVAAREALEPARFAASFADRVDGVGETQTRRLLKNTRTAMAPEMAKEASKRAQTRRERSATSMRDTQTRQKTTQAPPAAVAGRAEAQAGSKAGERPPEPRPLSSASRPRG